MLTRVFLFPGRPRWQRREGGVPKHFQLHQLAVCSFEVMPLILGLTVCSLQGERGHKGFKVREALFSSVCQQRPLSTMHSLFILSVFPRETKVSGDGTELTDAR